MPFDRCEKKLEFGKAKVQGRASEFLRESEDGTSYRFCAAYENKFSEKLSTQCHYTRIQNTT
jgi:hypothetical protein